MTSIDQNTNPAALQRTSYGGPPSFQPKNEASPGLLRVTLMDSFQPSSQNGLGDFNDAISRKQAIRMMRFPGTQDTEFGQQHKNTSNGSQKANRLVRVKVKSARALLPGGKLMEKAGLYHQWIEGPQLSRGMGNMRGVPGENGQTSPDMPYSKTQVVDHKGRDFKKSMLVPGVDLDALRAWTKEGLETGPWTPLINDCNTYVKHVLKNSTPHDLHFDHWERALPGGFKGSRDPFQMGKTPKPLLNIVIYPDGTCHKAATKY